MIIINYNCSRPLLPSNQMLEKQMSNCLLDKFQKTCKNQIKKKKTIDKIILETKNT